MKSLFVIPLIAILLSWTPVVASGASPIVFEDVTESLGLAAHLDRWLLGHGGAWGDATGNGRPELYIGAFADRPVYGEPDAPIPNLLFLNQADGFVLSPDEGVRFEGDRARTAMVLFVDLNNNAKLDLLVGMHGAGPKTQLFANRRPESFLNVTPNSGGWPMDFHMRNATAIDLDRDGLLDLILIDGRYGRNGQRVVVLRNRGDFQFDDVSQAYGFPDDGTRGLGLAVGDVNNDGRLDIFVAHSNRLFVSGPDGRYREYQPGFFRQPGTRMPCGAAFADLTGNDLLDLVVTDHGRPGTVFLYLNRGIDSAGMPIYEKVTDEAGLGVRFDRQTSHLALVDLDNNGRRDILLSIAHRDDQGRVQPLVLRNTGLVEGIPRFEVPPVGEIVGHYVVGPVADYDRDGRVDIFLAPWSGPASLFRNVSQAGHYLNVRVVGRAPDLNSMGIGATVRVYRAGAAGQPEHLLGRSDIAIGSGYASGEEALAHFGLGELEACDLVVTWQDYRVTLADVAANQYLEVPVGVDDRRR